MTKDEALKLALEALESIEWHGAGSCWVLDDEKVESAEAALREAVAQPERPWVRLTEVDMLDASRHWRHAEDFMAGVYWAAGTLKEKNT